MTAKLFLAMTTLVLIGVAISIAPDMRRYYKISSM